MSREHDSDDEIARAHGRAVAAGEAGYLDPETGTFVFTSVALAANGTCCDGGCHHCPLPSTASTADAIRNTHARFEVNSGSALLTPTRSQMGGRRRGSLSR